MCTGCGNVIRHGERQRTICPHCGTFLQSESCKPRLRISAPNSSHSKVKISRLLKENLCFSCSYKVLYFLQPQNENKRGRFTSITRLFRRNKSGRNQTIGSSSSAPQPQTTQSDVKNTLFPAIVRSPNPLTSSMNSNCSEPSSRAVSRSSRRSSEIPPLKRKNTDEIK